MSKYRIFPICEPDISMKNRSKDTPCEYVVFDEEKTEIIPTLEDIINDKNVRPFSKGNFIQYLSNSHCLENYEFIVFMNRFLNERRGVEKTNAWQYIVMTFLLEDALKEINLPCTVKNMLVECEGDYPEEDMALKAKMIIYDLLCDSYNDFVKLMKLQIQADYRHESNGCGQTTTDLDACFRPKGHSFAFELFTPLSSLHTDDFDNNQVNEITHNDGRIMAPGNDEMESRGSSIGSLVDSLKNNDIVNWRKTVRKFKFRRFLNEV